MISSVKMLTFLSMMLAMMLLLVAVERMLPPLPLLPPGFSRLGLANVIVMYVLFFIGKREAVTMAFLKAVFNFLLRGPMAGVLSLAGGLLSALLIIALLWLFASKLSYVGLSVAGAIGHNAGQLVVACFILGNWLLFAMYFPILLVAGVIFGSLTGVVLKAVMPMFDRIRM